MTFRIGYVSDVLTDPHSGNTGRRGEIVLGEFRESFLSVFGYWTELDYLCQWKEGLDRLVTQKITSCLITSIWEPKEIDIGRWWVLYPADSGVAIQEKLILIDKNPKKFSPSNPYDSIPARRRFTDRGETISEWFLPITDFEVFRRTHIWLKKRS